MKTDTTKKAQPKAKNERKLTRGELRSLGAVGKEFKKLWAKAQRDNLYARYEIGELVNEVRGSYGEEGIKRLADQAGLSKSLLYVYGKIVALVERGDLKTWLAKAEGRISWSHLYVLAEKSGMTSERRDSLLAQVIKENLSARELKRILGGDISTETEDELHEDGADAVARTERGPRKATPLDGLRAFDRAVQGVIGRIDEVDATFAVIEQFADSELNSTLLDQLAIEVSTLERLKNVVPALTERAEHVLAVVRSKVNPTERTASQETFTVVAAHSTPAQQVEVGDRLLAGRLVELDGASNSQGSI